METKEKTTVRLLTLDPAGRILLMKCDDPSISGREPVFWATLGGGIEPGEDIRSAALREAREETGRAVALGPEVWSGEHVLTVNGTPTLFREHFVVAFLGAGELSSAGWSEEERKVIQEMRWWTVDELRATQETVFPAAMVDLLPDIIAGNYPDRVQRIAL